MAYVRNRTGDWIYCPIGLGFRVVGKYFECLDYNSISLIESIVQKQEFDFDLELADYDGRRDRTFS